MLKTNTTFCAISRNRFFNQFISVKKISYASIVANANKAIRKYKNALRNATLPLVKTFAAIAFASFINANANAQCNVFQNADAANPLLSVLPKNKTIAGFAFGDIDGDGLQDVYVDFLGKPEAGGDTLYLYKNIGTKTHPVFKEDKNTGFGKSKAGGQNGEMQFVDIDGDGDLDFFASDSINTYYGNNTGVYFYKNVGTPQVPKFIPSFANFLPIGIGANYITPFAFADIDGDGDYDLFTSDVGPYILSAYYQRVYFNTGTPQYPVFTNYVYSADADEGIYRTYYDWNKDGLLDYFDIFDAANIQYQYYYKNIGPKNNPKYIRGNAAGPRFKNGFPYRMIDLNNDGAPEVFDFTGHYSTLAPVAVIQDTIINNGGKQLSVLISKNRSANYTYRWEYNGTTIPGANHYYLVASQAGIYTLYLTDDCGIGVSQNDTVSKNNVQIEQANDRLAVLNNSTTLPFTVSSYPHPFTSTFTLQLSASTERKESMVKITDLAGRVYLSQQMSASSVQLGQRLSHGIYTIQVWQEGKMIYHTIILKQ